MKRLYQRYHGLQEMCKNSKIDKTEEHNRVLTDHCADLLFCPTKTAVQNLEREGVRKGVYQVGDPMYDAVLMFSERARQRSTVLYDLDLKNGGYLLATVHRAYNTDNPQILKELVLAFASIDETVVFPIHPRTRQKLQDQCLLDQGLFNGRVKIIDPVDYLDMLVLEQNARLILTDSGGVQKEAFFFAVPCLTLRPETEWVETVKSGWNLVVGTDRKRILNGISSFPMTKKVTPEIFGNGKASTLIVAQLSKYL